MMKKVAIVVIFLCTLLAVVAGSAEQGFCSYSNGYVWIDLNGDGVQNSGEGLAGVNVTLWEEESPNNWIEQIDQWSIALPEGVTNSGGKWGYALEKEKTYKFQFDLTGLNGYAFNQSQIVLQTDHFTISFDPNTGYSGTFSTTRTSGNIYDLDLEVVATPIPSAAIIFGSGLIGLAGIRRKFKKSGGRPSISN